jgi:broad specificity phosphatase PhoE
LSLWTGGDGPEIVQLVLWRHGQTAFNAERRFQGQTDVPLNEAGFRQAEQAAPYLAALRPDAIFSSDLSRAASTAAVLGRLTGLPVQLDKDLRERGGGSWEGKTAAEIRAEFPEAYAAWAPTDGESAESVADRASQAMERIADSPVLAGGGMAVVVGHGGALSLGASRLLGIPDDLRVLGLFGNCRWSVLSRRLGRWRLIEHNVGVLPEPVLAAVPDADPGGDSGPDAGVDSGPDPGLDSGADSGPVLDVDAERED